MADLKQFKLPDIGEGLTEADILTWHVKVGDVVEVNQIIVEVETAKAAVELPSPLPSSGESRTRCAGDSETPNRPTAAATSRAATPAVRVALRMPVNMTPLLGLRPWRILENGR